MQMPRRTTALASLALLLAPVLSSCGFDDATDRENTIAVGANDRSGSTDVLAGVIVSAEDGEGVFIASLVNGSATDPVTLTDLTGENVTVGDVGEIELPKGGWTNLAEGDSPITVSGDFVAGNFVPVTLSFSNGEQSSLKVPVVRNCGAFADVAGLRDGAEVCDSGNDLADEGGH